MHVTVDETWNHTPSFQVDPLRGGNGKAHDVLHASRSHKAAVSDCERFGLRVLSVKRRDLAVEKDEIGCICHALPPSTVRLNATSCGQCADTCDDISAIWAHHHSNLHFSLDCWGLAMTGQVPAPSRERRNEPMASSACAAALNLPMLAGNPCGIPIHTSSRASTLAVTARSTKRSESSNSTSSSPT